MWGAFVCGVGAIPVLLAVNAIHERAAMAPPPAAHALSSIPALPAPIARPSPTPPLASATGHAPSVNEPARTGTLPALTPPALYDDPKGPGADPIRHPRTAASDPAEDSVPLPRPGEPRLPVSQSLDVPPPPPVDTASRSDLPSADSVASSATAGPIPQSPDVPPPPLRDTASQHDLPPADSVTSSATAGPIAKEAHSGDGSANPEPIESARATDPQPHADEGAPDAASPPEPDRPLRSEANAAVPNPPSSSVSSPLPPVRPAEPAQAQPLPSDRVEFASQVVPPKRHEPSKRRTHSSKRRKAPPAAQPAIPLEQQFEWIQQ
jgi:hypothetical protein